MKMMYVLVLKICVLIMECMFLYLKFKIFFKVSLMTRLQVWMDCLVSLKFADPILAVLLSICFTCMFKHCYLPSSMLDSVIVPLVKNRNGDVTDLSDKNNYRPIALSSTISKVFENVILYRLEKYLWTTDNQFGFKAGHSTDLCVYALTELIEYFNRRSTSVYVAFFRC